MVLAFRRSLGLCTRAAAARPLAMLHQQQKAMKHTHTLVLIRHGESEWNKQNRFTGWYDVQLSEKGTLATVVFVCARYSYWKADQRMCVTFCRQQGSQGRR